MESPWIFSYLLIRFNNDNDNSTQTLFSWRGKSHSDTIFTQSRNLLQMLFSNSKNKISISCNRNVIFVVRIYCRNEYGDSTEWWWRCFPLKNIGESLNKRNYRFLTFILWYRSPFEIGILYLVETIEILKQQIYTIYYTIAFWVKNPGRR